MIVAPDLLDLVLSLLEKPIVNGSSKMWLKPDLVVSITADVIPEIYNLDDMAEFHNMAEYHNLSDAQVKRLEETAVLQIYTDKNVYYAFEVVLPSGQELTPKDLLY